MTKCSSMTCQQVFIEKKAELRDGDNGQGPKRKNPKPVYLVCRTQDCEFFILEKLLQPQCPMALLLIFRGGSKAASNTA